MLIPSVGEDLIILNLFSNDKINMIYVNYFSLAISKLTCKNSTFSLFLLLKLIFLVRKRSITKV